MAFTTFTHIRASKHLLLGAVATGFLFPYIALVTESIRVVFLLHSFIGIGMDILCMRARTKTGIENRRIETSRTVQRG
jgi:hypothetical protein